MAVFFDREGHGEYFDSYGYPPLSPVITRWLAETTRRWTWNTQTLQSDTTAVCGHYCLLYAARRARDVPMSQIVAMFTGPPLENDVMVYDVIGRGFLVDARFGPQT